MVEELILDAIKYVLVALSLIGVAFHLLVLRAPETAKSLETRLAKEMGSKKKFVSWLEENNMEVHDRLINSRAYNMFAVVFLVLLLIFLFRA